VRVVRISVGGLRFCLGVVGVDAGVHLGPLRNLLREVQVLLQEVLFDFLLLFWAQLRQELLSLLDRRLQIVQLLILLQAHCVFLVVLIHRKPGAGRLRRLLQHLGLPVRVSGRLVARVLGSQLRHLRVRALVLVVMRLHVPRLDRLLREIILRATFRLLFVNLVVVSVVKARINKSIEVLVYFEVLSLWSPLFLLSWKLWHWQLLSDEVFRLHRTLVLGLLDHEFDLRIVREEVSSFYSPLMARVARTCTFNILGTKPSNWRIKGIIST
jgi:hypothetical protein